MDQMVKADIRLCREVDPRHFYLEEGNRSEVVSEVGSSMCLLFYHHMLVDLEVEMEDGNPSNWLYQRALGEKIASKICLIQVLRLVEKETACASSHLHSLACGRPYGVVCGILVCS